MITKEQLVKPVIGLAMCGSAILGFANKAEAQDPNPDCYTQVQEQDAGIRTNVDPACKAEIDGTVVIVREQPAPVVHDKPTQVLGNVIKRSELAYTGFGHNGELAEIGFGSIFLGLGTVALAYARKQNYAK